MITDYDKKLLTEAGKDYILDIVLESNYLKENISFKEHILLCDQVSNLTYEEVIALTITEDIRAFEGKFSKFLKYSLAAIAGMKFGGLAGPPVAMFALYIYRKLSDTCTRSCFRKMPLSAARKICKYQCQLNAAKKMANDIRSEVSKCSTFTKSSSCEKKLQKEYIKWAKRVQMLTIKLNRAKMTADEKERKARSRQLKNRAKTIAAGLDLSGNSLANYVAENKKLRQKLSFEKHLELYKSLVEDVGPVKINPGTERNLRVAATVGLFAVPIPGMSVAFLSVVKKFNAACHAKCLSSKENTLPHDVCYTKCSYLGAKHAVDYLQKELSKCSKAKDPYKCKKKIYNMLEDWKQREVERKIKFESALRKAIERARAKNKKGQSN